MKLNVVNGGSQCLFISGRRAAREPECAMRGAPAGVSYKGHAQSRQGCCLVTVSEHKVGVDVLFVSPSLSHFFVTQVHAMSEPSAPFTPEQLEWLSKAIPTGPPASTSESSLTESTVPLPVPSGSAPGDPGTSHSDSGKLC